MAGLQRIGLWFGASLESALAARAVLGELQAERPGASWVLFGPRSSLFLFEMDDRVGVYIPLRSLEPRRSAQSRLSYYLEKRAQFKKLRGLQLDECLGVSILLGKTGNTDDVKQFQHVQRMLGVGGSLIQRDMAAFMAAKRPLLEAGPQALAFATQHHRKSAPDQLKVLVLLNSAGGGAENSAAAAFAEPGKQVRQQWQAAETELSFNQPVAITVAAITHGNRLLARQLAQTHPDWLQVDFAQAMGLIAYADRVISSSAAVTQICLEMGREDRILLGKSNS